MIKNKFKIIALFFAIIVFTCSFSFAQSDTPVVSPEVSDNAGTIDENSDVVTTEENDIVVDGTTKEEEKEEIHEGDLYIFEDTVNMDKLVDGNVYIIGKDVTITGKIAGNLFVIAENLTIGDETSASSSNGYVFYNIYALAKKATFKSACYDLYVCGSDITLDSSFYLYRDLKLAGANTNIFGTIGRNADIESSSLNFKKDDSKMGTITGNLNYTANKEIDKEILESCVSGSTNYSALTEGNDSNEEKSFEVMSCISELARKLIFTIFVWLIILWLTPKFTEKATALISKKPLKSLGTGLLVLIVAPIIFFILLILIITIPISLIGIMLYALAISIAFSITSISVTYLFKDKFKLDKWYKLLGGLLLVRISLYLLDLIPVIGGFISFIALILGIGILVYSFTKTNIIVKEEVSKKSDIEESNKEKYNEVVLEESKESTDDIISEVSEEDTENKKEE